MFMVPVRNVFRQLQRRFAVSCAVRWLQDRVYKKQIKDVEELCQHVEEWGSLDQRVTHSAYDYILVTLTLTLTFPAMSAPFC